jgi:hypothetical protein
MALDEQSQSYIGELENEVVRLQQSQQSQGGMGASAMFGGPQKQNLVEWQLDFRPELEDIEHLLRGDVLITDGKKNIDWGRNPNTKFVVFNDQGVNDIIREIRMFLNKNTVLSNYREEQIGQRVKMLGHELRALIYNNYEFYGIKDDDYYKMNNYPIIVITILAMVESVYRRSINGEERRDLNSARVVQQNDSLMPQGYMPQGYPQNNQNKSKGGLAKLLPWNWKS